MTSENPIAEQSPTPNTGGETNAQTNQGNPNVTGALSIPTPPPPKAHCEITCKTEKDFWDNFKTGAEIFGIALLAVYTYFTIKMYCANKQAAEAATKAANTADASLKSSNIFNWRAQRAWIIVSANHTVTFTGPVAMDIQLDNLGITEAKNLDGFAAIKIVKKGEIPDLTEKSWKTHLDINVLVPKFHKTITVKAYKGKLEGKPEPLLTSDIATGMKNGSISLLIYGTLNYVDAWEIPHWTRFCDSIGAYNLGPQNPCADYTNTDENELK
jgi:hypothetical protein